MNLLETCKHKNQIVNINYYSIIIYVYKFLRTLFAKFVDFSTIINKLFAPDVLQSHES